MKRKEGKKIINICRILAHGIFTIEEIKKSLEESEHEFHSKSEIHKLLKMAEEHEWITAYPGLRKIRPKGKPRLGESEKKTGRPPVWYGLSYKGLFYMRFDTKLVDKWKSVEEAYDKIHKPTTLDSFNNLSYAIQKHPVLGKIGRPYYFDGELHRTVLNPFLFERPLSEKQVDELSDELVRLMSENVRPEFLKIYIASLKDSLSRLENVVKRHRLMINKIKSLKAQVRGNHLN